MTYEWGGHEPRRSQSQADAARFATSNQAEWLAAVDHAVEQICERLHTAGRHEQAWACLEAHLTKTETTRAHIQGPPPDLATITRDVLTRLHTDTEWTPAP
ncbi:MAG: hypothetical protein ACRDP1_08465 [Nocardioidaceae bacterium]